MILVTITLLSIFVVVYHHVGYPLILAFISRRAALRKASVSDTIIESDLPMITVFMPAFNEEKYIAEKIRNLAFLDYPSDKLSIIIAADGCKDETVRMAYRTCEEPMCRNLNIKIFDFKKNRGKVCLLNSIIPTIKTEIVVLSDVSSLASIDSLKVVAKRFEDESVGAVNGNYRLLNPGSHGESVYWEYQRKIKIGEESLGSVLGAHGAFYAIRSSLFERLPDDCVNDDFVIPMNIVRQGKKTVYEPRLNAVELEKSTSDQNWFRRIRIGFGNMQQIILLKSLFLPKFKGIAFAFVSGKGMRALMPVFMGVSLLGSIALMESWMFSVLAGLQISIYLIALLVHFFPDQKINVLKSIHYLVSGHLANFIGGCRFVFRKNLNSWS